MFHGTPGRMNEKLLSINMFTSYAIVTRLTNHYLRRCWSPDQQLLLTSNHYMKKIILSIFLLFTIAISYADNYPRNYGIDILHYSFDLTFSDKTDELKGIASISFQCKINDVSKIRLDLVNQAEKWKGNTSVMYQ